MENELDAILFSRTARGLEPTEAGDYLYEQAPQLLHANRQIEQNIQRISGGT